MTAAILRLDADQHNLAESARQEYEGARERWRTATEAWNNHGTAQAYEQMAAANEDRRLAWRRYQAARSHGE
jgi:hypothetical protein